MEQVQNTPQVHTAFNPAIIIGSPSTGETGDGELTINVDGEEIVKSKEYFNGQAVFDLSSLLQKKFIDQITEVNPELNTGIHKVYKDRNLFAKYSTEADAPDAGWDLSDKCALNAVVQLGESSDKTILINKFLTKFLRYVVYEGYPTDVYILTDGSNTTYLTFFYANGGTVTCTMTDKLTVIKSQLISPVETTLTAVRIYIDYTIRASVFVEYAACVPEHPFYIRWINVLGGRDHWMFTKRNEQKKSEITESFKPYVQDQEQAGTFEHVIAGTGGKAIVAGSGHINREDYEVLSDIVYSPKIEWYNETFQKWVQVKLDNPTIEKDYNAERADIELTFILPEIQMQY